MPARDKIDCPYSRDELAGLYETYSSPQLVDYLLRDKGLSVSKSLVLKWLRAYEIPRRKYSPFSARRVECPFSNDRLHNLYWKEGLSCRTIGEKAEELLGGHVTDAIVQRWLREAGIKLREPHEWLTLRSKREPEKWKEHARKYLGPVNKYTGQQLPRWAIRKGIRAAAKAKIARRETRQCAYCGADVTRPASLFRHTPDKTFCSRSCSAKGMATRRRLGQHYDPDEWMERDAPF